MTIVGNNNYHRAGIAIRIDRKPILDKRMEQLGLKTIGDVTNLLITADESIIDALKPFADAYVSYRGRGGRANMGKKKLLEELKGLSPAELAEIVAKYRKTETPE